MEASPGVQTKIAEGGKTIKHLCLLSAFALILSSLLMIQALPAAEICGQYDILPVMDGRYIIQNNIWGAYTGQCVAVPDANATDFIIAYSRHNQSSVASYPSIFQGCHWGRCSSGSNMPLRVDQVESAPFSWSFSNRSSGEGNIWNAAAEAWFSPIPDSSHGYYGGAELMIWLDRQILQPAGEKVGRVFIGGAWWDVWQAKMGWNYIAYEREEPTDSVELDLMDFINDSLSRGYINRSWYLHNLQAGFEIQAGGEGLTSNSFSVLINGGEENGTEAFTSPPPF
jgi:cellulose 1,4-beta-cellobiosidase